MVIGVSCIRAGVLKGLFQRGHVYAQGCEGLPGVVVDGLRREEISDDLGTLYFTGKIFSTGEDIAIVGCKWLFLYNGFNHIGLNQAFRGTK